MDLHQQDTYRDILNNVDPNNISIHLSDPDQVLNNHDELDVNRQPQIEQNTIAAALPIHFQAPNTSVFGLTSQTVHPTSQTTPTLESPINVTHNIEANIVQSTNTPTSNSIKSSNTFAKDNASRKKTSDVWKYFSYLEDDPIEHDVKWYQCVCKNVKYKWRIKHGTSNFSSHLAKCEVVRDMKLGLSVSPSIITSSFEMNQLAYMKSTPTGHLYQKTLCRKLFIKSLISGGLPLDIIHNHYFRSFLTHLHPSFEIPTSSNIQWDIDELYEEYSRKVLSVLLVDCTSKYNVHTEIITSSHQKRYLYISISFITSQWKLMNFLLDVIPIVPIKRIVNGDTVKIEETLDFSTTISEHPHLATLEESISLLIWRVIEKYNISSRLLTWTSSQSSLYNYQTSYELLSTLIHEKYHTHSHTSSSSSSSRCPTHTTNNSSHLHSQIHPSQQQQSLTSSSSIPTTCKEFHTNICIVNILNGIAQDAVQSLNNMLKVLRLNIKKYYENNDYKTQFNSIIINSYPELSEITRPLVDREYEWKTTNEMIRISMKYIKVFQQLYHESGECLWIADIDWSIAHIISDVLQRISDFIIKLHQLHYCTSNVLLVTLADLQAHIEKLQNHPIELIRQIGYDMLIKIKKCNEELPDIYIIAHILDPRFKMDYITHFFTPEKAEYARNVFRTLYGETYPCTEVCEVDISTDPTDDSQDDSSLPSQAFKKLKKASRQQLNQLTDMDIYLSQPVLISNPSPSPLQSLSSSSLSGPAGPFVSSSQAAGSGHFITLNTHTNTSHTASTRNTTTTTTTHMTPTHTSSGYNNNNNNNNNNDEYEDIYSEKWNILLWWKMNEIQYPHLAQLAKQYLSISSSSMCTDKYFGNTEHTRCDDIYLNQYPDHIACKLIKIQNYVKQFDSYNITH